MRIIDEKVRSIIFELFFMLLQEALTQFIYKASERVCVSRMKVDLIIWNVLEFCIQREVKWTYRNVLFICCCMWLHYSVKCLLFASTSIFCSVELTKQVNNHVVPEKNYWKKWIFLQVKTTTGYIAACLDNQLRDPNSCLQVGRSMIVTEVCESNFQHLYIAVFIF